MAATTISEFKTMPCTKCGGSGRIAQFQHRNGGECFRCGATGHDPVMVEVSRDMTDEEVIAQLEAFGFTVDMPCAQADGFMGLFLTDEQVETQNAVMAGARAALAAI